MVIMFYPADCQSWEIGVRRTVGRLNTWRVIVTAHDTGSRVAGASYLWDAIGNMRFLGDRKQYGELNYGQS